jgi:drug/metabolite transporter (DMT)-like permease
VSSNPSNVTIPKELETARYSTGVLVSALIFHQTLAALCFPVSKYGLEYIEPFTFAFYRFLISSVLLFVVVKLKRHSGAIERRDYIRIIALGALIIPFNQTLYLWGQSLTAAGHGAFLFATVPIWIFLTAVVHLGERPSLRRTVGIVVAVAGVIVIVTAGAMEIGTEYLWGDALILIAVIAWAYYTVLGKPLVRKYGALRITAYTLISGSIMYFPFGLYRAANFDYSVAPVTAWLSVVYMAVGTSLVAYVLWYWVLKYMEASRIAVYNNIEPLIASVVAYFWLSEPIGLSFVIGGMVVLSGVILAETQ